MSRPLPFDPIAEAQRQWDIHWGPEAVPSMAAVTSIMRAQQIIIGRLNELLDPLDLTFPRYEALMLLFYTRKGELPLGKISDRLQVHRASVTNVIDRLVRSGYVVRASHTRDRRAILAQITPEGKRIARRGTRLLNDARFGVGAWSEGDCDRLYEILRRLRLEAEDFTPPAGDA